MAQSSSDFFSRIKDMASKTSELACTYAALILHDEGVEITQDKIAAIVQAAKFC